MRNSRQFTPFMTGTGARDARSFMSCSGPRAGAAAWAVIDVLAQHPIVTAPVATAATERAKAAVYQALEQLEDAGVIKRLSGGRRNQAWEATGLLDLIETMDAGSNLVEP